MSQTESNKAKSLASMFDPAVITATNDPRTYGVVIRYPAGENPPTRTYWTFAELRRDIVGQ